jgi:hypothetical protein
MRTARLASPRRFVLPVVVVVILGLSTLPEARMRDAGAFDECEVLPRPQMRIRLSVLSTAFGDAAAAIQQAADEAWSPEGIAFEWLLGEPIDRDAWVGTNIWIVVQQASAARQDPAALGAVTFVDGQPRPLIRLSLDAAVRWVQRYANGLAKTRLHPLTTLAVGDTRALVLRAVGAAAAHELGHYVLASSGHARDGLMQAIYDRPEMLREPSMLMLDGSNRTRLRARLARSTHCDSRVARRAR